MSEKKSGGVPSAYIKLRKDCETLWHLSKDLEEKLRDKPSSFIEDEEYSHLKQQIREKFEEIHETIDLFETKAALPG